jgi:hypothetical protein
VRPRKKVEEIQTKQKKIQQTKQNPLPNAWRETQFWNYQKSNPF